MKGKYTVPIAILLMIGAAVIFGTFEAQGAPEAEFDYTPSYPDVDEEVKFDASGSDGEKLKYYWDFGDGHDAEGVIVNHSYSKTGDFQVKLIVSNATGAVDMYDKEIHVNDGGEGLFWIFFTVGIYVIVYGLILLFGLLAAVNLILGGILAYRTYARARENDQKDVATPYLVAFLISGMIGFFMSYLAFVAIIAHIVIYVKFKKRMRELGFDIGKKEKRSPKLAPRGKRVKS